MTRDLKELFEMFISQKEFSEKLRPATIRGYRQSFHILLQVFPNLTVDQLTTETMNRFFRLLEIRERIVGKGILKKGVKASTILTYRSKLNTFIEWLISCRDFQGNPLYVSINPFRSIKYPKPEYDDRRWIGHEDVEKIINALNFGVDWINLYAKKRNIAAILTLIFSGMRTGELVGLHLSDIDSERRLLTIRGETSKGKKHRVITIHPKVWMALMDYLEERKKRGYTCIRLFTSNYKDEPFTANGLKNIIKQITKVSGVKFHAHRFRHTFAVNMSMLGTDIFHIKEMLGHKTIAMTTTYLRQLPASKVSENINNLSLDKFA